MIDAERIDPPVIGGIGAVLHPPLEVEAYMRYLAEHRAEYARIFGVEPHLLRGAVERLPVGKR